MASQMPALPRVLFTVIEPISFVSGFISTVLDTSWFVEQQVPQKVAMPVTENSIALALQLGNMYLVLAFIAVAIYTSTSEVKVIRRFLTALALGDVGHTIWSCHALGMERLMKPAELNTMAYANVAMTIFLFTARVAYLGGALGQDGPPATVGKKRV